MTGILAILIHGDRLSYQIADGAVWQLRVRP